MRNVVYAVMVSLLSLACVAPVYAAGPTTIDVTASNWKFTPGTITVHLNQATTLNLISKEGVHGIASADLGISNTFVMPKSTSVTFTPHKVGTYQLHCTMPCGPGHANMVLIVKVVQ
ncbi:MAG TPA: cupredoxin domain-containing protein [Candidatus Rubrimentiphilum sp.]|nr:cupredoxin domain-containing protein [Candidatus Rubrimentiphilum sp.]